MPDQKGIQTLLSSIQLDYDDLAFHSKIFRTVSDYKKKLRIKENNILKTILEDEYADLSYELDLSGIQESCSVRNVLKCRALAIQLIDDKGELNKEVLLQSLELLSKQCYSLGPEGQNDSKRNEHILKILKVLVKNGEVLKLLKKCGKPISNIMADELIRETLGLSASDALTDAHARRAVMAAWLTYLRQNVGSCFATAPAEIIHDEQPLQFLQDMHDLLAIGQLKRTIEGVEYTVPLSSSWGNGDLKKPILVKFLADSIEPLLWDSPGLIKAAEAVNLLSQESPLQEKIAAFKKLILEAFPSKKPYEIVTAELILRTLLLNSLQITEKQLEEFNNRPPDNIWKTLSFPLSFQPSTSKGSLSDRCSTYNQQFAIAKNAFKRLSDCALLKAWEFTLASFSENKSEFTKWNLFSSLGMASREPGGIGECIYNHIQHQLDHANRKLETVQMEYEAAYHNVKIVEARIRQTSSEKELEWIKMEYQSRMNEFHSVQSSRDIAQALTQGLVAIHNGINDIYMELFKNYFQEVYDADTQEVSGNPFDDSPAGFRLLCKHGRASSSQWTFIRTPNEFIDALTSFFTSTESMVISKLDLIDMDREVSELVTAIIHHIRTKSFLESAFYRMAAAHGTPAIKNPLQNLDKIDKKPWAYTSGGTMNTLIQTYFKLSAPAGNTGRWVENGMELLVFLVDTLKQTQAKLLSPYLEGRRNSLLMQSPTHAFLLKPNQELFKEAWTNDYYTYTFLRDYLIKPTEFFIDHLSLSDDMIQFIVHDLALRIHENYRPRFKEVMRYLSGPMNPVYFRLQVLSKVEMDKGLNTFRGSALSSDEIDSYLYTNLPLIPKNEVRTNIKSIFLELPGLEEIKIKRILELFDEMDSQKGVLFITANQLQELCKSLLCLGLLSTFTEYDYPRLINRAAQKLGLAMPPPIIFADTNWVKDNFAFLVNPGAGKLELWRVDDIGRTGAPMSAWKQWLNGSRHDLKWIVYNLPYQYGSV